MPLRFSWTRQVLRLSVNSCSTVSAYFWWKATTGSSMMSRMSIIFPHRNTSGCFVCMSQPTWAKKKPRLELWGSASVSLNLWCTRWSRTQSKIVFCWKTSYWIIIRDIRTWLLLKLKLSHNTPWRRLEESSEWSASHSDRTLAPGKRSPVPIVQEAGWAPEPVWTQRIEEKCFRLCRESNLDRSVVQSVARHCTDWATGSLWLLLLLLIQTAGMSKGSEQCGVVPLRFGINSSLPLALRPIFYPCPLYLGL
jgi:hypothetical protein